MLQPPESLKQFCYHRSYPCNNRVTSGSHPCNKNVTPQYRARCPSPREPVRVVPIDAEIVPNCTKCKKNKERAGVPSRQSGSQKELFTNALSIANFVPNCTAGLTFFKKSSSISHQATHKVAGAYLRLVGALKG